VMELLSAPFIFERMESSSNQINDLCVDMDKLIEN
jgi:hypothetical protein